MKRIDKTGPADFAARVMKCTRADQVAAILNECGICHTSDNCGNGFIIWKTSEGHTRIYKPYLGRAYVFQKCEKTHLTYSGVPVFEPSGTKSF